MELVIKIPDEEYNNICLMSKDGIGMALYDWIANGTPLPKGHGDLIDKKEITAFAQLECNGCDVKSLDEFTTIIEADECTYKETGCGSCKSQLDCPVEAGGE